MIVRFILFLFTEVQVTPTILRFDVSKPNTPVILQLTNPTKARTVAKVNSLGNADYPVQELFFSDQVQRSEDICGGARLHFHGAWSETDCTHQEGAVPGEG